MWKWIKVACQETKPVPGDQLLHSWNIEKRKLWEIRELKRQWSQIHTSLETWKSVLSSGDESSFTDGALVTTPGQTEKVLMPVILRLSHSQAEQQIKISIPWPSELLWERVAILSKWKCRISTTVLINWGLSMSWILHGAWLTLKITRCFFEV